MLDLVNVLPDRNFYREEVLKAIPGCGDDWHGCQRYRFAACMAFEGDELAKKIMYDSFPPGPRKAGHIAIDFVEVDGLKGFTFAAPKLGALMVLTPGVVDADWLWWQILNAVGMKRAEAALREAAAADSNAEKYRQFLNTKPTGNPLNYREVLRSEAVRALPYEKLRPKLGQTSRGDLAVWGKRASAAALDRAAQGLLQAQTAEEQIQHLRIFARTSFPSDPGKLLELALSSDTELARTAGRALANVANPSVRDLAFRLIESRATSGDFAIAMLDRNFQPGDHEIALRWFENETDRDERHRMEMDLKEFCRHHPDSVAERPVLLSLYENGPCSFCREDVVRRLIELDALSPELRRECEFDANEDIRQLVAKPDIKT